MLDVSWLLAPHHEVSLQPRRQRLRIGRHDGSDGRGSVKRGESGGETGMTNRVRTYGIEDAHLRTDGRSQKQPLRYLRLSRSNLVLLAVTPASLQSAH